MWQLVTEIAAFAGAFTGIPALVWQFHEKRTRIRLEITVGQSVYTTNGCVTITVFNDGPKILVDQILVRHSGEFPPHWKAMPKSEFKSGYRPPPKPEGALELRTGDHTEAFIPFEWHEYNKADTEWGVVLKLRNGRLWYVSSEFIGKGEIRDFLIRPIVFGILGPARLTRRRTSRKSRRAWKKLIEEFKRENATAANRK